MLSTYRILIVEDNMDDAELYQRSLEKVKGVHYLVEHAKCGKIAQKVLADGLTPDCILLDYSLPGQDGLALLKDFSQQLPETPIIMLTGNGDELLAAEAIKCGAHDYMVKSDGMSEPLEKIVSAAIEHHGLKKYLAETESKLKKSISLNEAIMASTSHLIISTDLDGMVTSFNAASEKALQYETADLVGTQTLELWHDGSEVLQRSQELTQELGEEIQPGFEVFVANPKKFGSETREWTLYRKDGTSFPASLTVTCIRNAEGDITGYLGVIEDISEKKKKELERDQMIQSLKEANEDLEKFAYVASHDLKSPLRAIENLSEWLMEDAQDMLDAENLGRLQMIQDRIQRMEKLLDALLDYAKAGISLREGEAVSVYALVQDVKGYLHIPPEITVQIEEGLSDIRLPKMPLVQIFQNLIHNAIKHHHEEEGCISVCGREEETFYEFSVADDGPGIPKAFQDKIFDMFQKLKSQDEVEGSGMGLALVRKLVSRLGGTICVSSEEGKGATFTFTVSKEAPEAKLTV